MIFDSIIDKRYLEIFEKYADGIFEAAGSINWRKDHSYRVMNTSLKLARHEFFLGQKIDYYSLSVGALFHDIDFIARVGEDRVFKFSVERYPHHGAEGAKMIDSILGEVFKTDDRVNVDLVKKIITGHCRRHDLKPELKTIEERIVADADNLEKIGLFMFWRSATYTGLSKRPLKDFVEYQESEMELRIQSSLKKFFFDVSKNVANKRYESLQNLMSNFKNEIYARDI